MNRIAGVLRGITLLVLLICALSVFVLAQMHEIKPVMQLISQNGKLVRKPDRTGEKAVYEVKLGTISLGRAVFKQFGATRLRGNDVFLSTFETTVTRFKDLERIYSDPQTLLPVRVERSISIWPFPEKITEDYDQDKFILTINKTKAKRTHETLIKKQAAIHNAVMLPFYVRDMADFNIGYSFKATFPTQEFTIKLVGKEEIEVPAGKFSAYRFESEPERFQIWISDDERKIPLRIKGATGIGYTLSLREYSLN